jgi:V8-like Glu-specific endopeptidase
MSASGWGARLAFAKTGIAGAIAVVLLVFSIAGVCGARAEALAGAASEARGAIHFWTPERMREAQPLDVRLRGRPQIALGDSAGRSSLAPRVLPPSPPGGEASASSKFETVPDPTAAAERVNGAVFIITPFGLGRCSGTSVNAPSYSVVFTAGHCINEGGAHGRWFDFRWVFVPGYRYGQRPFGVFPAKWIDTTRQWRRSGSENFDVAAAVVTRNERGELLGKAVGGAGIAWGLKARQTFDIHGYPVAPPFDGETQQICPQTPFLGHDARSFLSPGPLNLAVDCDVTGGASGGGWTIRDGVLNSVTNYGYPNDPDTDFGAYFGKEVARLYHRAAGVK